MDYDSAVKFAENLIAKAENSNKFRKSALHARPLDDQKGWQVAFEFNPEHHSYKEWIGIREDFYCWSYDLDGWSNYVQIITIYNTTPITWYSSHMHICPKKNWANDEKWAMKI